MSFSTSFDCEDFGTQRLCLHPSLGEKLALTLIEDLRWLESQSIQMPSKHSSNLFDIREGRGEELVSWLLKRIRYVLGPEFDWQQQDLRPKHLLCHLSNSETQSSPGQAYNMGAYIYLLSKADGTQATLTLDTGGELPILSTRVGLIQIDRGWMENHRAHQGIKIWGNEHKFESSESFKRILRLATLFHEARHSDGQGEHAGFPHPPHNSRSDKTANGAYTVEALFVEILRESCEDCSPVDKKLLSQFIEETRSLVHSDFIANDHPECFSPAPLESRAGSRSPTSSPGFRIRIRR